MSPSTITTLFYHSKPNLITWRGIRKNILIYIKLIVITTFAPTSVAVPRITVVSTLVLIFVICPITISLTSIIILVILPPFIFFSSLTVTCIICLLLIVFWFLYIRLITRDNKG